MFWSLLAVLCGVFSYVISNPVQPCKLMDANCLHKISVQSFTKLINGDPELGTETTDPMHHDLIDGNLSILKFKLTDSTTTGLKNCQIENVKLNSEVNSLHIDLLCPKFTMTGKYDIHGRLIILPVEGNGDYRIDSGNYRVSIEAEIKVGPGKDGKNYMSIKNFKHTAEPLGSVKYDFKNLFNGQKDLAEAVLKFANQNWYDVAKEVQDPIFTAIIKKLIKNANKIFKTMPLDDLISK